MEFWSFCKSLYEKLGYFSFQKCELTSYKMDLWHSKIALQLSTSKNLVILTVYKVILNNLWGGAWLGIGLEGPPGAGGRIILTGGPGDGTPEGAGGVRAGPGEDGTSAVEAIVNKSKLQLKLS